MQNKFYRQSGVALILTAFILALIATAYLLKSYDQNSLRVEQDKKTYLALNQAKQALIAWSASHLYYPGQMPFPDRNGEPVPNYDGLSDCNSPTSTFSYSLLIGQLPVYGQGNPCTAPQTGIGENYQDTQGNRLWYAVSRNLVHKYESAAIPPVDPIINPSIISNPVEPWLVVRDRNGNVISNRVAAVIIAPGNVLTGQNRAGAAPNANQYLDSFSIGAATYSNANYDMPNEDFIMGQDSRDITEADVSVTKPYQFNDKLVFITIDELMAAVTNRASAESSKLLSQYRAKNTQFPYAANLGATPNNHASSGTNTKGLLPIDMTDTCSCASASSCSCSFNPILNVVFRRGGGTAWTSSAGSCTPSGADCTCTGAGSCTRTTRTFSCDTNGLCTHNVGGANNTYTYSVPSYADIYSAGAGCIISGARAVCNNAGTLTIGLKEPDWFKTNLWQDYFYYEWSPLIANLQAGLTTGVDAILIGTGDRLAITEARPTGSPIPPTSDITYYLDSIENTNNDLVYDAVNKQKSNLHNDQVYIISP
ncbi:MAG: hypothetical protein BVN34_02905 [Proteobacteria bacterium ST_bin12]|nr:MAG: hypothetical protein BVN34_02905 [Proteobacteria bacterium ST_bin12]